MQMARAKARHDGSNAPRQPLVHPVERHITSIPPRRQRDGDGRRFVAASDVPRRHALAPQELHRVGAESADDGAAEPEARGGDRSDDRAAADGADERVRLELVPRLRQRVQIEEDEIVEGLAGGHEIEHTEIMEDTEMD